MIVQAANDEKALRLYTGRGFVHPESATELNPHVADQRARDILKATNSGYLDKYIKILVRRKLINLTASRNFQFIAL